MMGRNFRLLYAMGGPHVSHGSAPHGAGAAFTDCLVFATAAALCLLRVPCFLISCIYLPLACYLLLAGCSVLRAAARMLLSTCYLLLATNLMFEPIAC